MSAQDLELALEWTNDVGEVTVAYAEAGDGTRSYQVIFDVRSIIHVNTHIRYQLFSINRLGDCAI